MLLIWGGWGGGGPRSHKHGHCNNDATTHDTWTSQDHGHSKFNAAEQRRTWHEQKRSYEELLPRHSLHMHNRFCKKRPQNCTIWSGCSVHHVNGIEHAHGATPGWGGPSGPKGSPEGPGWDGSCGLQTFRWSSSVLPEYRKTFNLNKKTFNKRPLLDNAT